MSNKINLLIVEDSATDAKLLIRAIAREYPDVYHERVQDAGALRNALRSRAWDAITCDWSMPGFSAAAALETVKDCGLDVPFILVSSTVGEENAVSIVRAGAADYVLKDNLTRLVPALSREIRERQTRAAHRAAERALKRSEQRFAQLAESGLIGIFAEDENGILIEANSAFLSMLGYEPDELLGSCTHTLESLSAGGETLSRNARSKLQSRGIAEPWEQEFTHKDGTRLATLVGMTRLEDRSIIAFVIDLSERKRIEEALRSTEEQLRQSQKLEAIGLLAGGIAHDFNNLLSVILSYSSLLAAELGDRAELKADAEQIEAAGKRAADLTRQLLAFSRQQVLQPRIINLNEILSNMERMLRRLIGENIELVVEEAADLGKVLLDASQIEQIIMNLAINARDAMPQGGKLLVQTNNVLLPAIGAVLDAAPTAPHVMLSVTDTGTGMDAATLGRIFEPFFTTKGPGKGTGLGLATVFGIVKQSGGTLNVQSQPGQGTTFSLYFPRTDGRVEMALSSAAARSTAAGNETILLVEDDEHVRHVARSILSRSGYKILEAQDGGEALAISEQHTSPIHLLLTDVVMPRMSGRQLTEQLAQTRPHMKVLYMSGYTDDSVLQQEVREAGTAFLQKPITPDMLTKKVREVLDPLNASDDTLH